MSGLHGPKGRVARALRIAVSPKTARILERRAYPPGDHGMLRKRTNAASVYQVQLKEKQRLRFVYNISEKQLSETFQRAAARSGSTGDNLLVLLETRLDAVVHRLGFARSMFAARQYVGHGHFEVNGRRTFIPSYRLRPGDEVTLRISSSDHPQIREALRDTREIPDYLILDKVALRGRIAAWPSPDKIPVTIEMQLVVEHYSR